MKNKIEKLNAKIFKAAIHPNDYVDIILVDGCEEELTCLKKICDTVDKLIIAHEYSQMDISELGNRNVENAYEHSDMNRRFNKLQESIDIHRERLRKLEKKNLVKEEQEQPDKTTGRKGCSIIMDDPLQYKEILEIAEKKSVENLELKEKISFFEAENALLRSGLISYHLSSLFLKKVNFEDTEEQKWYLIKTKSGYFAGQSLFPALPGDILVLDYKDENDEENVFEGVFYNEDIISIWELPNDHD